ncbi:MAG: hypothetical protein M2R45_02671 [Verrucomicrobia subdivision 3 bacterium]|nr:hypothetical protein [Limisphaerales bacterium]MCS1414048.1 hypothetical protein [Limisphaerales bacterium]
MNSTQDRLVAMVAVLAVIILLSVLAGDQVSLFTRALMFGVAMQLLFGIMIHLSLIPAPSAKRYRIAYNTVSIFMMIVVVGIILLDQRPYDPANLMMGMEPATALLVFGISLGPIAYVFLWLIGFYQAIFPASSSEALEKFKQEP